MTTSRKSAAQKSVSKRTMSSVSPVLTIRLPTPLVQKIKTDAERRDTYISSVIREVLERHFEQRSSASPKKSVPSLFG